MHKGSVFSQWAELSSVCSQSGREYALGISYFNLNSSGAYMTYTDYLETPAGSLEIQASATAITGVVFVDSAHKPIKVNALTDACKQQLTEYLAGKRKQFDLPLMQQGTDFQKSVWRALTEIPFGKTLAYVDIAQQINKPSAVRAVGAANGKNPISIIVPCHRVIGRNGRLTGYAGGIERKAWLLTHEGLKLTA